MTNIKCWILGHVPVNIDEGLGYAYPRADCDRCGDKLAVMYDMAYGNTVVVYNVTKLLKKNPCAFEDW